MWVLPRYLRRIAAPVVTDRFRKVAVSRFHLRCVLVNGSYCRHNAFDQELFIKEGNRMPTIGIEDAFGAIIGKDEDRMFAMCLSTVSSFRTNTA